MRSLAALLRIALLPFGVVLLVATAACGGGGSAPPPALPDLFSGAYGLHFFTGDSGPAHLDATGWSVFTSNGAGMVTQGSALENRGGTILGPTSLAPHAYAMLAEGGVRFTQSYTYPGTYEGGMTADGSTAVLATVGDGDRPGVAVMGRRRSDFTATAMQGSYHMCALFRAGTSNVAWLAGTATLDPAGIVDVQASLNTDGVISASPVTGSRLGTWAVGDGEAVVWTADSGELFEGGILLGGELVVLTGSMLAGGLQAIIVLIRKEGPVTPATFSGRYHAVSLTFGGASHGCTTTAGVADGAGGWTFGGGVLNVDGIITPTSGSTGSTYAVLTAGEMSFGSGSSLLVGGISSSGRCAVVAGRTGTGDPQELRLFIRTD